MWKDQRETRAGEMLKVEFLREDATEKCLPPPPSSSSSCGVVILHHVM